MSNKMLIDASHPEETRVAVVRGNRIEEFDFESQEKKQLRGNIYLAKVTRVEPSLQAAFVDYGGNRHGFLAFSEIHPDYYQIPVADRQALLEAEAAEARAHREAEEKEDASNEVEAEASDEAEDEAPKKKPRRRRTRKAKAAEDNDAQSDETGQDDEKKAAEDDVISEQAKSEIEEVIEEVIEEAEEKPKPKRRTSRRKPAAKKAASDDQAAEEKTDNARAEDSDSDDDTSEPGTMAAIIEMDSISEDLPDESDSSDDTSGEDEPAAEEKPKPKRKTTRRKPAAKKKQDAEEPENTEEAGKDEGAKEDSSDDNASNDEAENQPEAEEKPKKRAPRRRSSRSKKKVEETADTSSDDEDDSEPSSNGDAEVENVGQEDALEEVPNPRRQRRHYKIQEVIKRRQVLLVQVVKEERGNKGAALTTYLSLAGRYSVLMPNTARGGGISRKITNAADRKRLKGIASKLDVPQGMGVILRTAGASRTDAEINRDFEYLMRLWEQVRNLTLSSTAPCLVYEEGSLIKRSIRDLYDKDTGEILVSGEHGYAEAREFMGMLMPEHVKKVKHFKEQQAIFSKFGVETQLERMVAPQVTMKSGGYLVINQTEALVAVDVNSGRSTREHSIEDTALQTNLEAAEEVARQLRLRDLAGLIVIDFIDMEEKRNNRAVEKRLKDCLKSDRARIQVGRISHFGLMEMSRQRMRSSVLESTMDVCEHCAGLGYIRSDSAIALHVFRAIEEHVSRHNKFDAIVKTTRPIAFQILNHKRASLLELEAKYGLKVLIEGDASISGQEFVIEKGEPARGDTRPTAIGFQNEAAFDAISNDDDEENATKQNKRGHNRHSKSSDDNPSQETSSRNDDGQDISDEDRPRRKRRRGKRGGRRKNAAGENGENNNSEETVVDNQDHGNKKTDPQVDPTPRETGNDDSAGSGDKPEKSAKADDKVDDKTDEKAEASEEKPKRRNRVTQKAPVQKKPESQPETSKPESKEEPPRPARRRTTRRVAEKVVAADAESGAVNETIAEATPVKTDVEQSEKASDAKDKTESASGKKGWWNRGGGFF